MVFITIPVMGVGVRLVSSKGFTKGFAAVDVGLIMIEEYVAVSDI